MAEGDTARQASSAASERASDRARAKYKAGDVFGILLALVTTGVASDPAAATDLFVSADASTPGNDRCAVQYAYATGGQTVCPASNEFSHSVTVAPSQTSGAAFVQGGNFTGNLNAGGIADIAKGSLAAYAVQQTSSYIMGDGGASFHDTLHFTIAGASASAVTELQFAVNLVGTLASGDGGRAGAGFIFSASGGTSNGFINAQFSDASGGTATLSENDANTVFTTKNPGGLDAIVSVDVVGSTADIDVWSQLGCDVGYTGSCDFGSTNSGGSFGFIAQRGVSFTSDSLVFPTADPGLAVDVPEPASWALMLGGFGVVGATLRRRRIAVGFL